MPPERVLDAADRLFADADDVRTVTMDAVAATAGVGKGTIFRAFGNQRGLLDALWARKLAALRQAVEHGPAPLGPGAPPRERALAFLDALLLFKLENLHLIRARERAATVRRSTNYTWTHEVLESLIRQAAPEAAAGDLGYAAHALLAALDIDLIEELLATGRSREQIRHAQAALARAVLLRAE